MGKWKSHLNREDDGGRGVQYNQMRLSWRFHSWETSAVDPAGLLNQSLFPWMFCFFFNLPLRIFMRTISSVPLLPVFFLCRAQDFSGIWNPSKSCWSISALPTFPPLPLVLLHSQLFMLMKFYSLIFFPWTSLLINKALSLLCNIITNLLEFYNST